MLIGLMWLPNQSVFIQFHPVTYMVKLNIEMSMAKLITRLASRGASDEYYPEMSNSHPTEGQSGHRSTADHSSPWAHGNSMQLAQMSKVVAGDSDDDTRSSTDLPGIHRRTEIEVVVVDSDIKSYRPRGRAPRSVDDELPLTSDAGHPKEVVEDIRRATSSNSRDS
jgi:hypothetical protein